MGQRGDLFGLGQPSGAAVGPGESAGRRLEDDGAATAQRGHVVDGGGVEPHLGVHRGCEQHRTSGGQQRGGQQVVGPARDGAGQQVRGGGRDDDEVGFLPDPDMRDLVDVVPDAGVDGVTRQGLEGRGADESQRGLGGNDADVVAGLGELTDHGARLVGGDASGDADDDPLAVHAQAALRPRGSSAGAYSPSVCSSRSSWISRSAIDSGFSCRPGSTSGPTYSRMPSPSWL